MTTPFKLGLIGTGRIGQVHARSIAALNGATLQWVADPFIDGANRIAAEYGVPNVTEDPLALINSGDVDAVVIASPTPTHVDLISAAIDAGVPALCEKPIDLDIDRVDALREKARTTKTPIALGFNRRFDPHFAEIHRRVESGQIGKLEQLTIISRDPAEPPLDYVKVSGGIFRDMTIHDFDMARFFVPNIVEVTARGGNQFSSDIESVGDYDSAVVTLRGESGELITITNSRHSSYGYDQRLEAFGSLGMVQATNVGPTTVRLYNDELVEAQVPYENFFLERYADAYRLELVAFIEAIRTGTPASPGFEDGRAALLLANAAEKSAAEGITVKVDLSA